MDYQDGQQSETMDLHVLVAGEDDLLLHTALSFLDNKSLGR